MSNEDRGQIEDNRWLTEGTTRVQTDVRGMSIDGSRPWQRGAKNAMTRAWEAGQGIQDRISRESAEVFLADEKNQISGARQELMEEMAETGGGSETETAEEPGETDATTSAPKEGVLLNSSGTPEELFGKSVKAGIVPSDETVSNLLNACKNAAAGLTDAAMISLVDFAKAHFKMSWDKISERYPYWREAEEAHDVYVPAFVADESASKRKAKRRPPIIDVIKVPYSRSVSDTICTYNLAIFGGSPYFRFEGTNRRNKERSARIVEQELHYNLRRIGFEANIYQIALDNNRYGMSPTGVFWSAKGNLPVNINPWSYFPDPRVTAQNRDDAGFSGYNSWMSMVALARRGCYDNLHKLSTGSSTAAWE